MADTSLRRLFLHFPEGNSVYVCITDEKRRAFDFTDNTFKASSKLSHIRDACLVATGQYDPRADYEYSYRVNFDLSRLLMGSDPATNPCNGAKITIHWLRQLGDEPNATSDQQLSKTCNLKNVNGHFEPAYEGDADQLDEERAFKQREKAEEEYRSFVLRDISTQGELHSRLIDAVKQGDVGAVLRVVADDITHWAGNLKPHMLHCVCHSVKDPLFVKMRMIPKDTPFRFYETWISRNWVGSHEAYDLLEFHKSTECARNYAERIDRLREAAVEFNNRFIECVVKPAGNDIEGIVEIDEARKGLKHMANSISAYIDIIATQLEAANGVKTASHVPALEVIQKRKGQGSKRSTERGEGRTKLIAALVEHHKYVNGSCLNTDPIRNNDLAKLAAVANSTASAFFMDKFEGHTKYRALCRDTRKLVNMLKALCGEFSLHDLYGSEPPEKRRDGRKSRAETDDN